MNTNASRITSPGRRTGRQCADDHQDGPPQTVPTTTATVPTTVVPATTPSTRTTLPTTGSDSHLGLGRLALGAAALVWRLSGKKA